MFVKNARFSKFSYYSIIMGEKCDKRGHEIVVQ